VILEWRFIGGGANVTIVLDGAPVYGIAVDEHVVLRVAPSEHVVTVTRRGLFPTTPPLPFGPKRGGATTTGSRRAWGLRM